MALSGNFLTSGWYSSSKKDYTYIKFSFTATQSISGNYSDIAWQIAGSRSASGFVTCGGFRVVINGETVLATTTRVDLYNGTVAASGTKRIYHDASGSASFSVSVEAGVYWSWQLSGSPTVSGSGTFTLNQIPRAAALTAAPNFNDEENPTITYTNPAGSVVQQLDACISFTGAKDDIPYRAISKTGTSYTFNLTEAERETLRNATRDSNSRTVIFYVRTTIGGAQYHSTLYRTLTIVNAEPTLDPFIWDTNEATFALTGGAALIRHASDVYYETGATARKGAELVSQSITCAGVIKEEPTGYFPKVQSGDFVITATDSRGNTTTQTVRVPFVEYVNLTCSIGNSKPDTDGSFTLTASGVCYNGDIADAGSNDLYVLYRYKVSGGDFSDWAEMSITKGDNSYTATADFTGLNYRTTYIFQCKAGDLVATATTDEVAIKSLPVFDWSGGDFNFNVPVKAPSLELDGVPLDYIVQQGTSGIWTYRLWNSGIAECWGRKSVSTTITTAWGSLFSSGALTASNVGLPFTFKEVPCITVALTNNGAGVFLMAAGSWAPPSTTTTGAFELVRGTSSTTSNSYGLNYQVKGRWK